VRVQRQPALSGDRALIPAARHAFLSSRLVTAASSCAAAPAEFVVRSRRVNDVRPLPAAVKYRSS